MTATDDAIARGLAASERLDALRVRLDDVLTGLLWVVGPAGADAVVSGALIRVKAAMNFPHQEPARNDLAGSTQGTGG